MKNTIDVLLGLQWGDEGKGKIIDVLTKNYDIIARFQGGPNAGHSLEFDGKKYVLHLIPSGIFHPNKINLLGGGMVIDPIALDQEIKMLEQHMSFQDLYQRIKIAREAKLILPTHKLLDLAKEKTKEKNGTKIGSTGKGIGPCYEDHTSREGIRISDILEEKWLEKKYFPLKTKHLHKIIQLEENIDLYTLEEEERKFLSAIQKIKSIDIVHGVYWLNEQLNAGKKILAEGAQGTLLDIEFGTYPFVTSSHTSAGGVCTSLGIAPNRIGKVYGLFKAYCTRVGNGPFPTELTNEIGELLQMAGNEIGATTGRKRRCGWLDLPNLKYACMINGVTELIISKVDVLGNLISADICTGHKDDGRLTYRDFLGWGDINGIKNIKNLPMQCKDYLNFIEEEVGIPITMISIGPDRTQILYK